MTEILDIDTWLEVESIFHTSLIKDLRNQSLPKDLGYL